MNVLDDPIGSASALSRLLRLGLFLCGLFALFNWLDGFAFGHASLYQFSRRDVDFSLLATFLYASTYGLCMLGLLVLYCHASASVRLVGHALTLSTVTVFLSFKGMNDYGFSYHEASLFWSERSFLDDALREFWSSYLLPLGLSAGLVAGLWAVARIWMPIKTYRVACQAKNLKPCRGVSSKKSAPLKPFSVGHFGKCFSRIDNKG